MQDCQPLPHIWSDFLSSLSWIKLWARHSFLQCTSGVLRLIFLRNVVTGEAAYSDWANQVLVQKSRYSADPGTGWLHAHVLPQEKGCLCCEELVGEMGKGVSSLPLVLCPSLLSGSPDVVSGQQRVGCLSDAGSMTAVCLDAGRWKKWKRSTAASARVENCHFHR